MSTFIYNPLLIGVNLWITFIHLYQVQLAYQYTAGTRTPLGKKV